MTFITYTTHTDTTELYPVLRQYNSALRFAYNRWQDNINYSLSEVEKLVKNTMNNISLLDASLIKLAVNEAKSLRKRKHVIFGSDGEFTKLKYKKTTANKEKYQDKRSSSMLLRGSAADFGNRKAVLDITNNKIIVKISRKHHIVLPVKFSNKQTADLLKLQNLCKNKQSYFNLVINRNSIGICFDLSALALARAEFIPGRVLAFDSNPNYLGIVVKDGQDIIHKEILNFKDLNNKQIKTNKKKFEKSSASKYIVELAKHYKCEAIGIEKLNIKSKDNKKGKTFNRLVNNTWHRTIIRAGIIKHACLQGVKVIELYAAYSSITGCIMNPHEVDSVAAAIELAERCQKAAAGERYNIDPKKIKIEQIPTHWKEMVSVNSSTEVYNIKSLFDLYVWLKKAGISYRFLYTDSVGISLRHKSHKSLVFNIKY